MKHCIIKYLKQNKIGYDVSQEKGSNAQSLIVRGRDREVVKEFLEEKELLDYEENICGLAVFHTL